MFDRRWSSSLGATLVAAVVLGAAATCSGASPGPGEAAVKQALESVSGRRIREVMIMLADDAMEGRETGRPGFQRAADSVATRFAGLGLEPAGDGGTYFQSIRFFETRLDTASATAVLERGDQRVPLALKTDYICGGGLGPAHQEVTAPLVFVGFGVHAPEYSHDDFAGVEVRGKILVELSGAPPGFATDQRAFYSSGQIKSEEAVRRGAVGLVTVRTPEDEARRPWARLLPGLNAAGMHWIDTDGTVFHGYPELVGTATLSQSGARKLFELAGANLDSAFAKHTRGETGSFDLGVSASFSRDSRQRTLTSSNVAGVLRGSDPRLRNEYLVFTAHLDHLGLAPADSADRVYNGAYDNAAGVATILEIARAAASLPVRPRRSLLFLALTGEEKGLQGSSYFAHHPTVPVASLVADLNIDMPYLAFPIADLQAFGVEHSTLATAVREAAAALGLTLTPDPLPQEVRFVRSDQFSFVQAGIPALAFKPGSTSTDPSIQGDAMLDGFMKTHYHQPSDDASLPFSEAASSTFARAGFLTALGVADREARPAWNPGDFFGARFARVAGVPGAGAHPARLSAGASRGASPPRR